MKSREIVERTINFSGPERFAVDYYHSGRYDTDVFVTRAAALEQRLDVRIENGLEKWHDLWGNTWARVASDKTSKGEVIEGAMEDWAKLDKLPVPDVCNNSQYQQAAAAFAANRDKYCLAELPGFCFSIARKLRRLDNFLIDIKLEPENVCRLLSMVESVVADMVTAYADAGVDGIFFCEDWGTQERLLMHPDDWKKFFKPAFARLCSLAQSRGLTVWMHSCGYIWEIIPHLIEVGIKVLQLDQPELMGLERLGREFGGKVSFWSPCDIQKVLPTGDKGLIEESVRRMCGSLYVTGGGLIAKSYGSRPQDLVSIGVSEESNEFAYQCFLKYGAKAVQERN